MAKINLTVPELRSTLLQLSADFHRLSHEYDTVFLGWADPRAVQGGATCEDAGHLREIGQKLRALYTETEEID